MGGAVSALAILADTMEKGDYITVVSPTIQEKTVNAEQEQYGYKMILDKIEFAANETRVYVTFSNNGSETFNLYTYGVKAVQDGAQYETEYNYEADYPEVASEILPGVTSSGIIVLSAMDPGKGLSIYFEGSSDNYEEDIDQFVFQVE